MPRVVVLGGGYAGLACLIELAKKDRKLELHLVDAQQNHCKLTNLHKTFREPVEKYSVPYAELAERFRFSFHQHKLSFAQEDLARWQQQREIALPAAELPFDWLVIATGAAPVALSEERAGFGQQELRSGLGNDLLRRLRDDPPAEPRQISLVGGGATGLQTLFELHELLRKEQLANQLRLIDLNSRLVPGLPEGAHRYIVRKLRREGIEYLPETSYLGQVGDEVLLSEAATGREFRLPSQLTLVFPGVASAPFTLETNAYGQVLCQGQELERVFSAGDCAHFNSSGLNYLTAQAAVRKGKLVARNLINQAGGRKMHQYRYQEKGYLVSLGAIDAVGWLGLRCNLASGFPASVIKDAMEAQYDLFLDGVDTYLGFP